MTVVVVTYESPQHVIPCVEALRRSRGVDLTVIVVDNSIDPAAQEAIRVGVSGAGVIWLPTGLNLGFTGGNNLGFAAAMDRGATWVATLNDDTLIDPDALRLLIDALERHPNAAAASPTMLAASPPDRIWWGGGTLSVLRAIGRHDRYGQKADVVASLPPVQSVSFLTGCCILFRSHVLGALGGFREDYFMYGEDVDLSLRFRRAGHELLWVTGARLIHKVAIPEPEIAPHKIVLRDRNRRRTVRAHYGWWERLGFTAWFVPTRFVHLVRYAARGDWARARMVLRGAWER